MKQYLNWKSLLILIACIIVASSLLYTNQLAKELANEEKKKVEMLVEGIKVNSQTNDPLAVDYFTKLLDSNKTIPLILADEDQNILNSINVDQKKIDQDAAYLNQLLLDFQGENPPIIIDFGFGKQYVYYGESIFLKKLRYFSIIQIVIILIFILVVVITMSVAQKSIQNQVWVGLSKETAHQLGTPLSSIEGWLVLLQEEYPDNEATEEIRKDLSRLKLVADRFGKVGSIPQLSEVDLIERLEQMVDYMQRRAPQKVSIRLERNADEVIVPLSPALFDWVVENLIRNALDAMDGSGSITIQVTNSLQQVILDVTDTGKGMAKSQFRKVFRPGYTTKKRGWGLGLSLAKRIINTYHHGNIFIKNSEPGKGTTFRIILKKV